MPLTRERTSISRKPAVSPTISVVIGTSVSLTSATTTGTGGSAWAPVAGSSPQAVSALASARAIQPRLNISSLTYCTFIITLLWDGARLPRPAFFFMNMVNCMVTNLTHWITDSFLMIEHEY